MRLPQVELMIMWGCKDFLSLSLSLSYTLPCRIRQSSLLAYVGFVFAIRDCQMSVFWDHVTGESHDRVS